MIGRERIIALVPLRGGSKTVKNKNIRLLGGKPLLAWPLQSAFAVPEIDRVIVSTDDLTIANISRTYRAEVYERPVELATDSALVIDAIRHLHMVLQAEGETADIMVLLEATSPFRSQTIIQQCLSRLINEKLDSIATFHQSEVSPQRLWTIENTIPQPFMEGAIPWLPRQALKPAYQLNGVVYAFRLSQIPTDGLSILFGKMAAEIIDHDDVIDIDTERDLEIANAILNTRSSTFA